MDFKNVLVLAPHTDDGELGAGGGKRVSFFGESIKTELVYICLPWPT
jgi:hypothetical protein